MRSFLLDKLIRDKVFLSMQELGQKITHRELSDQELVHHLRRKLLEEANEFDPRDPNATRELADLLEVIEKLSEKLGMSFNELRELQQQIREERGSYDKKIYIARLDLKDDDPWADYYASDPERFPEIKT